MKYPFLYKKIGMIEPAALRTGLDRVFIEEHFLGLEPESPQFVTAEALGRFQQLAKLEALLYHRVYIPLSGDLRFEWYDGERLHSCVARRGEMLLCNDMLPFRVLPCSLERAPFDRSQPGEEPIAGILSLRDPDSENYRPLLENRQIDVPADLDARIRSRLR